MITFWVDVVLTESVGEGGNKHIYYFAFFYMMVLISTK